MGKANDLRNKLKGADESSDMTMKQAVKRLTGAASTVAEKQSHLSLNCDKISAEVAQQVVDHLTNDGFGVAVTNDATVPNRVWFTMDWSNPPEEPAPREPNLAPIKRDKPKGK